MQKNRPVMAGFFIAHSSVLTPPELYLCALVISTRYGMSDASASFMRRYQLREKQVFEIIRHLSA
jgi:hypothetical protein